jgi:hypothetical protein
LWLGDAFFSADGRVDSKGTADHHGDLELRVLSSAPELGNGVEIHAHGRGSSTIASVSGRPSEGRPYNGNRQMVA